METLAREVEEISALVEEGQEEEAASRLRALRTASSRDPRLHLRLADLCEELGLGETLVVELNLAFRDAPDDLDLLRRLGQVHADAGRTERAVRCWRTLVERAPEDVEAWEELGALLKAMAHPEEARDAYTRALQSTGDRRFEALIKELQNVPSRPREEEAATEGPDDAVLVRFTSLFNGREGVYARQWANPQGNTGYSPVREPFNLRVARNHMLGNHTVGIYNVRLDNTASFGAIDLDLSKTLVDRSGPGMPDWDRAMARLSEHARNLVAAAEQRGLTAYMEDSGGKGRHVWFFLEEPMPARVVRRLCAELAREVGPPPQDVGLEVFPKQAQLPPNGLGNLIKLPLGVHRGTGRRAEFLQRDGTAVSDQYGFLMGIQRIAREAVMRYLEVVAPRVETASTTAPWEPGEDPFGDIPDRPALPLPEYHLDSDGVLQTVLARCITLRTLAQKADSDRSLSHDEANVLLYTLGHLESGPQAVNSILRKCPSVDARLHLKSRLRGNPMSCPRIRSKIPGVTASVSCHCEFPQDAGLYPNPLLHLKLGAPARGGELDTLQFQSLVQDFLRARRQLHDAERLYRTFSERMSEWFEQAGIEEFRTPMGLLRRVRNGGGETTFTLEV